MKFQFYLNTQNITATPYADNAPQQSYITLDQAVFLPYIHNKKYKIYSIDCLHAVGGVINYAVTSLQSTVLFNNIANSQIIFSSGNINYCDIPLSPVFNNQSIDIMIINIDTAYNAGFITDFVYCIVTLDID